MFLDPFIFTPPRPDRLSRAVESYQRVAAVRFCRYARDAENPDLLPRRLSGLSLEPSPKQLHAEVRALRHLTAIQRTLRDIGGPLFDPASPVPPRERFRLVERRMNAIEEALGQLDDAVPADSSVNLTGDSADAFPAPPGDFELRNPRPGDDVYHPPEIEDLLEAVDFAQTVFAARAELLDKRRLTLSPEDFLLEITALRDLTAVVRTLRRMSAHRLPEDQSPDDLQRELADFKAPSGVRERPCSSVPALGAADVPAPPERLSPSHASHSSHMSHSSHDSSPCEPDESSSRSPASSESVSSLKSAGHGEVGGRSRVDHSSSCLPEITASLRPVPKVPEVRPAVPSPTISSSHPSDPSSSPKASPADAPSPVRESPCSSVPVRASSDAQASPAGNHRKSRERFASLYQEEDLGPWGIWDTPPPEAIDESAPEFLADMKRFGYIAAWRRAAARLAGAPPPVFPPLKKAVLNDSDPPPD